MMLNLRYSPAIFTRRFGSVENPKQNCSIVVCAARGPRPRYPRVWKTQKRIGTISKSLKLIDCVKGLSNVKEEVYGALDSFIAWDLEFPLITVKKALKTLEDEKEWKRIIQVTKWMLSKGQGRTMGSYFTLLNAFAEDGRLDEAEELWNKLFTDNLESTPRIFFDKMVSIFYKEGMHDKLFEIFADMEELGMRPTTTIVTMVGDVFQKMGMLDKYKKLKKKYPPPTWEYRYIKGKRVKIPVKYLNNGEDNGGVSDNRSISNVDEESLDSGVISDNSTINNVDQESLDSGVSDYRSISNVDEESLESGASENIPISNVDEKSLEGGVTDNNVDQESFVDESACDVNRASQHMIDSCRLSQDAEVSSE